ncbi:MAG: SpoVR family protein [Planctomycetes bacterium]|nr:SpoVR family protein [Planctomycetota bacterium]
MSLARRNSGELAPHLRHWAERIEHVARAVKLDFFPLDFQLLDAADVNGIAAYGGFPVRYPSWRFGMEFERLDKSYTWGLSKIYELVINNDPVVAYLVRSNSDSEQKLVMAHVCGHADFFKHNCWFAATDRHMLDTMATHATKIRRSTDRFGLETVERFLDLALSVENLLDPYLPLRAHLRRTREPDPDLPRVTRTAAPTYDIVGFLVENAPLEAWQREILALVRAEAYYFQPQRMTRIMNEGWASFWHSRILTGGVLDASEIVDFADCHSGATLQSPGRVNPYKLGIELWRYAEERGEDIFRLRRIHNDASLLDELIDEGFVAREQLFVFGRNTRSGKNEVQDRDWRKVKTRLLADLAWGGLPQIELVEVDSDRELVLAHHHDGRDLQLAKAADTLVRLEALWKAPVRLETLEDGQPKRLRCERGEVRVEELAKPADKPAQPS